MRLAVCTLSAVLLSGCSWLNLPGKGRGEYGAQKGATYHGAPAMKGSDRCVIYSPVQPIPPGCDPAEVTLATGYQSGSKGGPAKYASDGYGSHANDAGYATQYHTASGPTLRKPKWRGSLSLGTEYSLQGNFFDPDEAGSVLPSGAYDPTEFDEAEILSGSAAAGQVDRYVYTSVDQIIEQPKLSFSDVYGTPAVVKGGLEYVVNPKLTLFANAEYLHAEGGKYSAGITAELRRREESIFFDTSTNPPTQTGVVPSSVEGFVPNVEVARFTYDYGDQSNYGMEFGARHYFDPIANDNRARTVTPFVSASIGATYNSAVTASVGQQQVFVADAFNSNGTDAEFYDVLSTSGVVEVYPSEWVTNGSVMGGVEWQVTPGTALALETGVKVREARKYASGASGDNRLNVPVTLRGSFNF